MPLEKHVLIADDDRDLVMALAIRCRSRGLSVDTAYDALSALRQADANPPQLVILDVNMPCGNGFSVCEMMSQHEQLRSVPVIMLTGSSDQTTIRRCHDLCAYYVPKGGDVWGRILPLLEEAMELAAKETPPPAVNAVAKPKPAPKPAAVREAAAETPPQLKAEAEHESVAVADTAPQAVDPVASPQSAMVDRVFSLLGWNEVYMDDQRDADTAADADAAPAETRKPWVLCIDDDADFSFSLKLRLEQQGVEVVRAFEGTEGYRTAFTTPAQAILLDYHLPNGNGDYVLRRLKENPVTRNIPVIMLSGQADRHLERKLYSLGAAAFFRKPYDWDELWATVSRYLTCSTAGASG